MTTKIKNDFDGIKNPLNYYSDKPLALLAKTSFGGATVREYESIDESTDFRTVLVHAFDLFLWSATEPTVETAKKWLHLKAYGDELTRLKVAGFSEGYETHEEAATRHAEWVVRVTEWECLTNAYGKTVFRGWFREDLS